MLGLGEDLICTLIAGDTAATYEPKPSTAAISTSPQKKAIGILKM